jgi:hypothetical protein
MRSEGSVQIIGPFKERTLVIDGWSVPLVTACEVDGGRIEIVVDHRLSYTVSAGDFDQAARMLANGIAVALGLPSHPSGDLSADDHDRLVRSVQHRALAPQRVLEIEGAES